MVALGTAGQVVSTATGVLSIATNQLNFQYNRELLFFATYNAIEANYFIQDVKLIGDKLNTVRNGPGKTVKGESAVGNNANRKFTFAFDISSISGYAVENWFIDTQNIASNQYTHNYTPTLITYAFKGNL